MQNMFFILTMLALAQFWNLLAGYAGLISVGQQAFVGLGAYRLFAFTILAGVDPVLVDRALRRDSAGARRHCRRLVLVFRLKGAYFAVGTWVVAEVCRLVLAQVKTSAAAPEPRCRTKSPTRSPVSLGRAI